MIYNKARFEQETSTPELTEVDMIYEIGNKYLIALSIEGKGLDILKRLSDNWNDVKGKGSVVIITDAPQQQGDFRVRHLNVVSIYQNGKITPLKKPMAVVEYIRYFADKHNILKLKNL